MTRPDPTRMNASLRRSALLVGLAGMLFSAGALGVARHSDGSSSAGAGTAVPGGTGSVAALQARVQRVPEDYGAWAALGLAYVSQARVTGDPSY